MEIIKFDDDIYPALQTKGFAAKFAFPFAKEMLSGAGLDIGCNREEWCLPGAHGIDECYDDKWDAYNLPDQKYDYIFSSHCLEHLPDWVGALNHWGDHLKLGGTMFLYLPHYDQKYWRPWNNRKHCNIITHDMIRDYFVHNGYSNIFVTPGYDLNHSFYGVACK